VKPVRNPLLWRWGLLVALALLILAAGLHSGHSVGDEGLVREGLCRQLLAGETPGRQGVISSVWWAPFPTLVLLPVVFLLPGAQASLACLLISALFGAGTVILLEQALRMWGAGRWRWLMALGVGCNPAFLQHCWSGSSLPMTTCFLVLCLYSLTTWVQGRRLGDLIWFAFGSAFLLGTSYEMSGWVLATIVVLALEEWRRTVSAQEKTAVLTVALLPAGYTVLLWLLMCWLIMGDPLYAMRSLLAPGPGPGGGSVPPDLAWWCYAVLAGWMGIILAQALRRHDRSGVCLAVLGLTLPGAAGLLAWRDLLWDAAPLLFCLYPAIALTLGYGLVKGGRTGRLNRGWGWMVAAIPLATGFVPLLGELPPAPRALPPHTRHPVAGAAYGPEWLADLERHVEERTPFAKVFVCGYESFALLKGTPSRIFEHALDFNFDKAKRDYYGHVLYLLVHRPDQRHAMDSVHWKYRNIYVQGGRDTLYDSDWGDWRLFELVQASAPK
jgi:hypothetical protein